MDFEERDHLKFSAFDDKLLSRILFSIRTCLTSSEESILPGKHTVELLVTSILRMIGLLLLYQSTDYKYIALQDKEQCLLLIIKGILMDGYRPCLFGKF